MNIPGYFSIPGLNEISATWTSALESIDRRNFGYFDEVVIVYKYNGSV
jgi:hypothetical protein